MSLFRLNDLESSLTPLYFSSSISNNKFCQVYTLNISRIWSLITIFSPNPCVPSHYQLLSTLEKQCPWTSSKLVCHTVVRVVLLKCRSDHVAPLLRILQWLLISLRVTSKVLFLYKAFQPPPITTPFPSFFSSLHPNFSLSPLQPYWSSC